jgi:hypothetical protein
MDGKLQMRKLYKFYWDCGRSGDLEGTFVCEEERIQKLIGQDINFGEVLGKHSEITGTLQTKDIEECSDDQEFIDKVIEAGLVPSGFNPLHYYEEFENV